LSGRVIGYLGLFVYYLLLARRFGASGIGDYSFAFAFASFFTLGVDFGLRNLLTRRVARNRAEAPGIAVSVVLAQGGFALLLLAILLVVSRILGYSPTLVGYLVLAFLALALQVMGVSFSAFLEAVGEMRLSAIAALLQKGVVVVGGIALVLGGASLAAVMAVHVLSGIVYLALGWRWARREFGPFDMAFRPRLAGTLFKAALPFFATVALWEIYSRIDIVMLHLFRGEVETGLYAAAYKLIAAPLFVAQLVGVAVFPTLARAVADELPELESVFRETLRVLTVLGLAGGVVLLTAGDALPLLLFGDEFAASGRLVRMMAPLFVLEFGMVPLWRLLLAMDRERTLVLLRLGSVGLNVALNLVLIPLYGPMGAVATSLISEGVLAVAQFVLCIRVVPSPFGGRGPVLVLVALAAVLAGLGGRAVAPWPLAALGAGAVFGGLVLRTGLVRAGEITRLVRGRQGARPHGAGDSHNA
ncbi:MAG: flippase, partial [Gemmatimonadota bacterium]